MIFLLICFPDWFLYDVLSFIIFLLIPLPDWFLYLLFSKNHALQTLIFFLKLNYLAGQISSSAFLPDLQNLFEKNNLFLKLVQGQVIRCIKVIALNLLHNVSRSVCKLECTHGFLNCVGRRAHSGNQVCFCATRKRILQQSSQL